MTSVLMFTSCSDDSEDVAKKPLHKVSLVLATGTYADMGVVTRALPDGFVAYSALSTLVQPSEVEIKGYLTRDGNPAPADPVEGLFSYDGTNWSSQIPVDLSTEYYVYGFMPASMSNVTLAPRNSDYANGAVFTITNLPAITTIDPCVIVGVSGRYGDNSTDIASVPWTTATTGRWGLFNYTTGAAENEDNYVYLLLDHLYAALKFDFTISSTYNSLRTIKVKQVALKPANGSSSVLTVNVSATLAAGGGANPLTATVTTNTAGTPAAATPIWTYDAEPAVLTSTAATTVFTGYVAPADERRYILETTYDVYDKADPANLVRENQKAENSLIISALTAGQMYTVNVFVNPTYLYQLSDPDLDNPTFTLTTP